MPKLTLPGALLRLEGLTVFVGAILLYAEFDGNGWLFLLLLLSIDISGVGYLVNPRVGSMSYNAAHTYVVPALLMLLGQLADWQPGIHFALIWFAHIGVDRLVGYGLKYSTEFKDTHLNRV